MRWFRSFVYNLKQGCKGIFRNSIMSTASVLVLLSCMIIVGTFYLVIANIEENFSRVDNLNVIEVRIPATYSDGQIEEIGTALGEIYKELPVLEGEPVFVSFVVIDHDPEQGDQDVPSHKRNIETKDLLFQKREKSFVRIVDIARKHHKKGHMKQIYIRTAGRHGVAVDHQKDTKALGHVQPVQPLSLSAGKRRSDNLFLFHISNPN